MHFKKFEIYCILTRSNIPIYIHIHTYIHSPWTLGIVTDLTYPLVNLTVKWRAGEVKDYFTTKTFMLYTELVTCNNLT